MHRIPLHSWIDPQNEMSAALERDERVAVAKRVWIRDLYMCGNLACKCGLD